MSPLMSVIHICSIYGYKKAYTVIYCCLFFNILLSINSNQNHCFRFIDVSIIQKWGYIAIFLVFIKRKILVDNKEHYLCSNFFFVCMHASGNLILLISIRRSFYYTFEQWKSCREWEDSTWRECKKNNNDKKSHSRIIWCT